MGTAVSVYSIGSMDLHGSEISRVGSRCEISRVCLQDGKISRICQRTKNFTPARCARITHTHPSPRDAREAHTSLERSHVHLNRAGAQLRISLLPRALTRKLDLVVRSSGAGGLTRKILYSCMCTV